MSAAVLLFLAGFAAWVIVECFFLNREIEAMPEELRNARFFK